MRRIHFSFILLLTVLFPFQINAGEPEYQSYPLPGHPVWIADLHPSDKLAPFLSQLQTLKLILMAPGIKKSDRIPSGKTQWYSARCFILQGKSENFKQRGIIQISAGKFQ